MNTKEINNIETLNLEISRLKSEINSLEQKIQLQVTEFKNYLNPVNLLFSGLKSFTDRNRPEPGNNFTRSVVKTGLLLLISKFLFAPGERSEKRITNLVDQVFDKFQHFFFKKKKTTSSFYSFDDKFDSESN